jgi:DNA mismatch endonuclease (patch repair protein)
MDILSPEARSAMMSRIRGKDTAPELTVRRMLFALGYRYRLHVRSLPGRPDLVFPARRKVIFVHGCFWHGHSCLGGKLPGTRTRFWAEKIDGNKRRDRRNRAALQRLGWESLVVWECSLRRVKSLEPVNARMVRFLDGRLRWKC